LNADNISENTGNASDKRNTLSLEILRHSIEGYYNDMGLESDGREPKSTRIADVAGRFLFSKPYTIYCILMALLNLGLLIWEVAVLASGHGIVDSWVFKILEIWVNITLIGEVALRAVSQQRNYCKYWGNILDVVVLVASLTAFIVLLSGPDVFNSVGEGIAVGLVAFRYVIAFLRVVIIVKNQGKYIVASTSGRVDLTSIGPPVAQAYNSTGNSTVILNSPHKDSRLHDLDEDSQDDDKNEDEDNDL